MSIRKISHMFGLMVLLVTPSCTNVNAVDPNETLQQSLSRITERESFAFQGDAEVRISGITMQKDVTFEGFVKDGDQLFMKMGGVVPPEQTPIQGTQQAQGKLYVRSNDRWIATSPEPGIDPLQKWNPLQMIHDIQTMANSVSVNRELSDPQATVLDVSLGREPLTQVMKAQMKDQFSKLDTESYTLSLKQRHSLSDRQMEQMISEMKQVITGASAKLEDMLRTLEVDASCRVWIDPETTLPQQIEMKMSMNYETNGQKQEETTQTNYVFRDYDKTFIIPE